MNYWLADISVNVDQVRLTLDGELRVQTLSGEICYIPAERLLHFLQVEMAKARPRGCKCSSCVSLRKMAREHERV